MTFRLGLKDTVCTVLTFKLQVHRRLGLVDRATTLDLISFKIKKEQHPQGYETEMNPDRSL